jgi:hypothetical protein
MEKQIELLKKYGVNNYTIENGIVIINGSLYLRSLTTVDKDFLKNTTINGDLDLRSLTTVDKDFLKGTIINGGLNLRSLTTVDKDFLKGTTINGRLDLRFLIYRNQKCSLEKLKIIKYINTQWMKRKKNIGNA